MNEQPPTIEKMATWIPVTDEMFVDFGMGTPEQRAEAAVRIDARQAASRATWRALPLRTRLTRRYRWRWYEYRTRMVLAWDALRGRHECER